MKFLVINSIPKFKDYSETQLKKNAVNYLQSQMYIIEFLNFPEPEFTSSIESMLLEDTNSEMQFSYYHTLSSHDLALIGYKRDVKTSRSNDFNRNVYNFNYRLDVWYQPAQTDNISKTLDFLLKSIDQKLQTIHYFTVKSVRRYELNSIKDIVNEFQTLKSYFQINELLHQYVFIDINHSAILKCSFETESVLSEFQNDDRQEKHLVFNLEKINDSDLLSLCNKLNLGLKVKDLIAIRNFYLNNKNGRISRLELETFAQTWSEHCKHRIFSASLDEINDGLYRFYIKRATEQINQGRDFCVSVFHDNAGAIAMNSDYLITHKVETHNSPSALDPFGGAITGILGVNRDCLGFGIGAKPILNTYAFCFAPTDLENSNVNKFYREKNQKLPLLDPDYILKGVIKGIEVGGNESGIPTIHGIIKFDESYIAKPLVFAGTVGLIPRKLNGFFTHEKRIENGDLILILGGRTGKDGIHGAIISSEELNETHDYTHVQIGDPITQKKTLDMILEMRDSGLINAITDNGAGGFSSSIGELGASGFEVDLDLVLLKTTNIAPHEIWVSESQERMTLSINPENTQQIKQLAKKHDVEYQFIGTFNNSGIGKIHFQKEAKNRQTIEIDLNFLHNGAPQLKLESKKPETRTLENFEIEEILNEGRGAQFLKSACHQRVFSQIDDSNIQNNSDFTLDKLLILIIQEVCPNLTRKVAHRFDYKVQGGSFIPPVFGPHEMITDASVTIPILGEKYGVAVSSAMYPEYGSNMSTTAVDSAVRQLVVAGIKLEKIALLDNFCWSDALNPERLHALKIAAKGCFDAAVAFNTPFISGKDSMFNDFKGFDAENNPVHLRALPTLLISSVGIADNFEHCITPDFKKEGDLIYILGSTKPELGGSTAYRISGFRGGFIPKVDLQSAKNQYSLFEDLVSRNLIQSAISLGKGGLALALWRKFLASDLGFSVNIDQSSQECRTFRQALFSESASRIIFTINPRSQIIVQQFLLEKNIQFSELGIVTKAKMEIEFSAEKIQFPNPTTFLKNS